jgi:short-subunit dehydrogenase
LKTKKAIIIGASSGIGKELAKVLAENGFQIGLAARRIDLLNELSQEIPAKTYVKRIDVSQFGEASTNLEELLKEMVDVELIVINAAIRRVNPELNFSKEKETIDINVSGFVAMATVSTNYFLKRGSGHIVGISSIAALVGSSKSPAYNASKAFVSNYMWGLRQKLIYKNIYITDIRPGLVDTPLVSDLKRFFWVASPRNAAIQIYGAIRRKRQIAYITRRWSVFAWLAKLIPENICNYFYARSR